MKRIATVLIILLAPVVSHAYYYGERATERNFERSALYFQSHYLNTYGLFRFQDVAVGLFDDPFLNLELNPANLPHFRNGHSLFYFDFRGDRTEAPIIETYYSPLVLDPYYRPDVRYSTISREEPEPTFSAGLLAYPFRASLERLFVGATYQVIYKEEPYYTPPYWIYYGRFGYDAFGDEIGDGQINIPVQERYYGEDALSTEAHLYSFYTGYPIARHTDVGVRLGGVNHTRDGNYINRRSDEYGSTSGWRYQSYQERSRTQDYDHTDFSGGVRHEFNGQANAGFQLGYLSGTAKQMDLSVDSSEYGQGNASSNDYWSQYYYRSQSTERWRHEGHTVYARANFVHEIERGRRVSGYYRYGKSAIDLTNCAAVADTSSYASRYRYNYDVPTTYWYSSRSATHDVRHGSGERDERQHQAMINLAWRVTKKSTVRGGVYYRRTRSDISTDEPVTADRWSSWSQTRQDTLHHFDSTYNARYEVKSLRWDYRSRYWTVQVPVVIELQPDERIGLMFGINRILERWETSDETLATFARRRVTENGQTNEETDFAERYTEPTVKATEDYTALLASADYILSPQFTIRLLVEPQTEGEFRIAQWWLSFSARL